jgi:phosphohistidine phosphatase
LKPAARTLLLLRHAKSSWDDPGLDDHDRPLAPRGRRASKLIAAHLRQQGIAPALVLCSSSARTRETLARIAPALGEDVETLIEPALYTASAGDLARRLRKVQSEVPSVMLIGHQPALQDLALSLAGHGRELQRLRGKFPTAALATLRLPGDWRELAPGVAEAVAFVKPRELEDRRR